MRITTAEAIDAAWERLGPEELVLEAWIDAAVEISVVAARGLDGSSAVYEPSLNLHRNHILDLSSAPAGLPQPLLAAAQRMAAAILERLGVVGVTCVEFFVTAAGELLVNEIAPRPHNSGHLTLQACATSQFEQQVRAVCGLPLGSPRPVTPAAMAAEPTTAYAPAVTWKPRNENGHQSVAISGHQRSSAVISGHQWPSAVISGHQWSSAVISGHQRSPGRTTR
jgi:phosphoribosylaminoimidazole carboxylase (NCAIR synthetase)